uniref:Uncharacterized protein n=1 Tax=Anguilla anguilla TaxID=7936 RepID=A0A0E9RX96_ANGAN
MLWCQNLGLAHSISVRF